MFNKLRDTEFVVVLLFFTIVMTWVFKLNLFPGLHADEAWFGIRAHIANNTGRFNWHGMNHYTGSLQEILSAGSFELLGRGVFELRIIGVLCNIFGLLFIINNLIALFPNRLVALVFMLLLSQSMLWLIYPRLAWEVCSLTLLFLSFTIWSSHHILNGNNTVFYIFVFYLTNLVGTYNHIIFACIPLAIFVATLLFSFRKGCIDKKILTIVFCNIINVALLYVLMNYFQGYFFEEHLDFPLFLSSHS